MKKIKKIAILLRLIEEGRYNIKKLTEKVYGEYSFYNQCKLSSLLTSLRKKGIPAYPQGYSGVVKVPSNIEEWRLINQQDYNRKRGGLMMHMRLVRRTLLEEPNLRKELLPQLNKLIIIASMGQVKKLHGNKTNKPKKLKAGQRSTKDGNKTDKHKSVKARSKTTKARTK